MKDGNSVPFNITLAISCAESFSAATGLACSVSDGQNTLFETDTEPLFCEHCRENQAVKEEKSGGEENATLNNSRPNCRGIHQYGMEQAERFGGQYIYCCEMGLTFFVSPIMEGDTGVARITAGPFLMVDREDYIFCELKGGRPTAAQTDGNIDEAIKKLPYVAPERVSKMATLLFMAVGFLNKAEATNKLLEAHSSADIQGTIGDFIARLKQRQDEEAAAYPFEKERRLLNSIVDSDRKTAQKMLNELLGHIFFSSGSNPDRIRARAGELVVLISRAAIDGGADPEQSFALSRRFLRQITLVKDIDDLCFKLSDVINRFTDMVFRFTHVKHVDAIQKAVFYIRSHFAEKISLETVSRTANLSPSYFSKIFRQEMNCTFNTYLNTVRIEKSKNLLLNESVKLLDIAFLVGFEDQSYFTKVFKKITGMSPIKFRESRGRKK